MENRTEEKKHEQKKKVSVFIDGSNFYHGLKSSGIRNFHLQDFIKSIVGERELEHVYYYKPELDPRCSQEQRRRDKRFIAHLKEIPRMHVIICPLKEIVENGNVSSTNIKLFIQKMKELRQDPKTLPSG